MAVRCSDYLLYLCRRVGGGVVLRIVVHWIRDFSTFNSEVGNTDDMPLSDAAFAVFLLSIALVASSPFATARSPPRRR